MSFFPLLSSFVLLLYCFFLWGIIVKWISTREEEIKSNIQESELYSILVPIRNEAVNIINLLEDLNNQVYKNLEVLILDDFSTDASVELITKFKLQNPSVAIRCIQLQDYPERFSSQTPNKKGAIELGISVAKGSYIITTDGDCRVQKDWILAYHQHIEQTKSEFISGPVFFSPLTKIFHTFQAIEFGGLIITGASSIYWGFPTMCNGANLCYKKSLFETVNGYEGVNTIASGDDEHLMHKIAKVYPQKISFLKNKSAIVFTKPIDSIHAFFSQRNRWASKWDGYQILAPKLLATLVWFANLFFVLSVFYLLFAFTSDKTNFFLICSLVFKLLTEFVVLSVSLKFFKQSKLTKNILILQSFYYFYVLLVGLFSRKKTYNWKGRKVVNHV